MKKQIAIMAACSMLFVNTGCFAADNEEWKDNTGEINLTDKSVSGDGVQFSDNTLNITKGGDFTILGTLSDGMIYVNTDESVKLRLSGASISNSTGPAIFFDNTEKGFITITADTENFLSDGAEYTADAKAALFSNDDLEIKGSGTLTIDASYRHGIASDDDLDIEEGKIIINSYEHGIKANNTVNITGGDITISSETGKGIKAGEAVLIDGGQIAIDAASEGIESKGLLTVNGGDIKINSKGDGMNTAIESATDETATADGTEEKGQKRAVWGEAPQMRDEAPQMRDEAPQMNGEAPQMRGEAPQMNGEAPQIKKDHMPTGGTENFGGGQRGGGFGRVDAETAAAHAITINGGSIYINTNEDGIDANGNLTINGGTVIIDGPVSGGDGSLDADGTFSVNGGVLAATGSAGMVQTPTGDDGQNFVRIVFSQNQAAGTRLTIADSAGEEIMSVTPQKSYQSLVFSSCDLSTGETYSVCVDGEESESFTVSSIATNVGTVQKGFGGGFMNSGQRRNNIKVNLNGKDLSFEQSPVIKNDTTLVPFRAIFEAMGAEVSWDEETQTVTATKGTTVITLRIGSTSANSNDSTVELLTAPEIIRGSTMVPVRFISESLNMKVEWDQASQTVTINS